MSPGDEVVILGRQGDESWQQIDAREMAAAIGTIPYEIVCRVGRGSNVSISNAATELRTRSLSMLELGVSGFVTV